MEGLEGYVALREKKLRGFIEKNIHFSKGDAGRILIIGGAERYVGAAVLAGLAALHSGVDSVMIAAPETSARLMNAFSPDLVTVKLPGDDLADAHLRILAELSENASVVLIGPGMGVSEERKAWLERLIPLIHAPVVLDADATKQIRLVVLERAVLFANKKEYEQLKETNNFSDEHLLPNLGTNVLVVKGKEDLVLSQKGHRLVKGGHSRATVSGTGDVLAGIAAAFYAQCKEPIAAAQAACIVAKKAAERLGESHGYAYLASDMVSILPTVLKDLRLFRVTKHEPTPSKGLLTQFKKKTEKHAKE